VEIEAARRAVENARLYGILDLSYVEEAKALQTAEKMLRGGVQILQLRAKRHTESTITRLALPLAEMCHGNGVPLILNDHPRLVAETNAAGAHIGQDDMPVAEARAILGPHAVLGKSSHSIAQATATAKEDVTYLGFGPLFATPTKPDYHPIGLDDIRAAHRLVHKPIFCIGGVKQENLPQILTAGAHRVVIVSGILQAPDIEEYCRTCREILEAK
jgi:thiamine-phosphate pyrophosphorylase